MTRDSNGWFLIIAAAVITPLVTHTGSVDALFPAGWHEFVHAVIDLVASVIGALAGIARMSPLSISPEGRVDAIQKNAASADAATTKVAEASIAMDKAATATDIAADKAQVAKDAVNKVP